MGTKSPSWVRTFLTLVTTCSLFVLFGLIAFTAPDKNLATATISGPAVIHGTTDSTELLSFPYMVLVSSQAEGWSNLGRWSMRVYREDGSSTYASGGGLPSPGSPLEVRVPTIGTFTPYLMAGLCHFVIDNDIAFVEFQTHVVFWKAGSEPEWFSSRGVEVHCSDS